MSRIYRALEKAEKEKTQKVLEDPLAGIFEEGPAASQVEKPTGGFNKSLERVEVPAIEGDTIPIAASNSFAEEQFRKLKTCIFRRSPHPPRLILITNAAPGEGKTTVALNLAMTISHEIQKKVILIDADLRKPNIFKEKYWNSRGLSDYLAGQLPVAAILTNFEDDNFMVIPAGNCPENPAELIGSQKMKDLIKTVREYNDDQFILIDSPPVLSASEPLLISEWVDGIILVIMAGQVPKPAVRRVIDTLGREKIIGVVFNQKKLKPVKHHYDRYYSYYKKQ
jgi:protein-tyrosine kinase